MDNVEFTIETNLFTDRSLWTMIHGIVLSGAALMALAAAIFSLLMLYAGGASGRTTLAVVIWLIGWGILHYRWKDRHISYRRTLLLSLILIGGSIVLTFPPLWNLF